jgi:hypothetical protein
MKQLFWIIGLALVVSSCKKQLTQVDPVNYSENGFYSNDAAISMGNAGVYGTILWDAGSIPYQILFDHYTPMAVERNENASIGAGGALTPATGTILSVWDDAYNTVAKCNSVLDGAKLFYGNFSSTSLQYLAEIRIIRAYAYYNLVNLYGDVPFFTTSVNSAQFYTAARTPAGQIVDSLLSDLDSAASYMPWISPNEGRVDKSVAYGLKARIALNAGSYNYNGKGPYYFGVARDAAKMVMDSSGRGLNPVFGDLFTRTGQTTNNGKELMWELMYSNNPVKKITQYIAFGQCSRVLGQCGRFPGQMWVDTYECTDGQRIDQSPLYNPKTPFKNRDPRLKATISCQGDTLIGNTGTQYTWVYDIYRAVTYQLKQGAATWSRDLTNPDCAASPSASPYGPALSGVGYLWTKYCHFNDETISAASFDWVIMRYAEILLIYAESKIELNDLDATVYAAINQVRNRSGMPGVSAADMGNQALMRQLVRRERKVELALEGFHLFDMRRWGTGAQENAEPTYGYPLATTDYSSSVGSGTNILSGGYDNATPDMVPNFKTSAVTDENDIPSYQAYGSKLRVRDLQRKWSDAFNLWPIPQSERQLDPGLTQNAGY